MEFWILFSALTVITTAASSSANSSLGMGHEERNSVAPMAQSIKEKILQLSDKTVQLKMKVEKILERQNDRTECSSNSVVNNGGQSDLSHRGTNKLEELNFHKCTLSFTVMQICFCLQPLPPKLPEQQPLTTILLQFQH